MADSQFPSIAFLWPALAAAAAAEMTSAFTHELARLTAAGDGRPEPCEPDWTTASSVALDLPTMRLRDFSAGQDGDTCILCAPFALHFASVADFAPGHSLVEALRASASPRLFVTDWRSATPEMRFLSIDSYLADLNVAVDEVGGKVDLVGLCQGGWMALVYAARFPAKVRKLVLAGAPVDIAAGELPLSRLASAVPLAVFRELVDLGGGRMLGPRLLEVLGGRQPEPAAIHQALQLPAGLPSEQVRWLEARFQHWYDATVNLPGTYYLQAVEWLYKQNRLAAGGFVALGREIDLARVRAPVFLLAARDDELVAPEQVFATQRHVATPARAIGKATAPGGHLGLFMGAATLRSIWPGIGRWLSARARRPARPHPQSA